MAYFRCTVITTLVFLGCSFSQANIARSDTPVVQSMDAATFAALLSKVASLEQKFTSQGEKLSSQQNQLANYESELNSQRGIINVQQTQIKNYQSQFNGQQNTISLLQSQITTHWVTIEQQKKKLMTVQHDLATANAKLLSLEAKTDLLLNISHITTQNMSILAYDIGNLNAAMASYQFDIRQNISMLENRTANEHCQLSNLIEAERNKSQMHDYEISSLENELKMQKSAFNELEKFFMNKSKVLKSEMTAIQEKQRNEESQITSHQSAIDLHNTLLNRQTNSTRTISTSVEKLESRLALLSSNLSHISDVPGQRSAFYAYMSGISRKVATGQTLKFEHVVTNEGKGYDPSTGIFTCNFAGFYVFSQSIDAITNNFVTAKVVKNGNTISRVQGVGTSQYDSSGSSFVIIKLTRGDRLWLSVERLGNTDEKQLYGNTYTSFSGFLLYNV